MKADAYYSDTVLEPVKLKAETPAPMMIDVNGTENNSLKISGIAEKFNEEAKGKIMILPLKKKYLYRFRDYVRSMPALHGSDRYLQEQRIAIDDGRISLTEYLKDDRRKNSCLT